MGATCYFFSTHTRSAVAPEAHVLVQSEVSMAAAPETKASTETKLSGRNVRKTKARADAAAEAEALAAAAKQAQQARLAIQRRARKTDVPVVTLSDDPDAEIEAAKARPQKGGRAASPVVEWLLRLGVFDRAVVICVNASTPAADSCDRHARGGGAWPEDEAVRSRVELVDARATDDRFSSALASVGLDLEEALPDGSSRA